MTKDAIQQAVLKTPFKPFALRFTDGSLLHVPHPEFIHLTPNGRTAVIDGPNGDINKIVDVAFITAIDFDAPNPKPSVG